MPSLHLTRLWIRWYLLSVSSLQYLILLMQNLMSSMTFIINLLYVNFIHKTQIGMNVY